VRQADFVNRPHSIPETESFVLRQAAPEARINRFIQPFSQILFLIQTPVTAITDRQFIFGDTSIVNMVRGACKKALFEPGDTRQQWKGEAAASFV
jgi:hypothetical protein